MTPRKNIGFNPNLSISGVSQTLNRRNDGHRDSRSVISRSSFVSALADRKGFSKYDRINIKEEVNLDELRNRKIDEVIVEH